MRLGEGGVEVRHVLVHLGRHHGVEARVLEGKLHRIRAVEVGPAELCAASARHLEHRLAEIDPRDPAALAHGTRHVLREQPRPDAHVEGPLPGPQTERLENPRSLADHVRSPVDPLEAARSALVELDHDSPSVGSRASAGL